jgi:hypothetical protein
MLMLTASGCLSQIRDEFDDSRVACFNHRVAKAAYCEAAPLYRWVDCPRSFKLGFMTGYIAMMNGANGCPPPFAPSSRICSLAWLDDGTPDQRRNAWYDGYSHGVLMAQETGASDINRIQARLPQHQPVFDLDAAKTTPTVLDPMAPPPPPIPVPLDGPVPLDATTPAPPVPGEDY